MKYAWLYRGYKGRVKPGKSRHSHIEFDGYIWVSLGSAMLMGRKDLNLSPSFELQKAFIGAHSPVLDCSASTATYDR